MKRREIVLQLGLGLIAICVVPAQSALSPTPKEATVTLEIRGMV